MSHPRNVNHDIAGPLAKGRRIRFLADLPNAI
jgi:hypothetical protein